MAKSKPQYASVEQPFGCAAPVVHCPICGKAVTEVEDMEAKVTPCGHLAFLLVGEIAEYEFQSADFKARWEALGEVDLDLEAFPEVLAKMGYGNNLLALEITYGGMGCGPVWYTDVYGFDYNSLK